MRKKIIAFAIVIICCALLFYIFYKKYEYKYSKEDSNISNNVNTEDINTDTMKQEKANKENNVEENKIEIINDIVGTLKIEKIGLYASIKEGSNNQILKDYIGHIEDTALYDGNVCLAAHNRGNKYSYFARINELEIGDQIEYTSKYNTRKYSVIKKQEIEETDWTLLESTKENKITLITCIKDKKEKRLCVQAIENI